MSDFTLVSEPTTHPGQFLTMMILAGNVSRDNLPVRLGISEADLALLLDRDLALTADLAAQLGQITATSPDLWLNLQRLYDLSCQQQASLYPDPAAMPDEFRAAVIDRPNGWRRAETGIPPATDTLEGGTA